MIPSAMLSRNVADSTYFIRRWYTCFHIYGVETIYPFYLCQFINDLEKDRQYWGWPSELQDVSNERVRNSKHVIELTIYFMKRT